LAWQRSAELVRHVSRDFTNDWTSFFASILKTGLVSFCWASKLSIAVKTQLVYPKTLPPYIGTAWLYYSAHSN
jgi:hypothetical protein